MSDAPGALTRPASPACPAQADIERLAAGDDAPDVATHVESCAACGERLRVAQDESSFLYKVRRLAVPGPEGAPRIPGYRVTGVISSGAQGTVYKGLQESTSRHVAIKVLISGDDVSRRQRLRAEREAEIAARLRHPNLVTVYESRTLAEGRIAVVMEFVDGVPLDAWEPAASGPTERQRAILRVFAQVCHGIHNAHLNGVIHRDLKPDNILVTTTDDGQPRPVVLDFGIAKAGGMRMTVTGEFAGTPAYASPEQVAGKPDSVDALTDVYSLGVILYRLLTGSLPYEAEGSIFEIARTIGETEPVRPRTRDPALSADLEAIILRTLRKDKERRYQSAAALGRDVERFLAGEPVEARSGSGWYLLRKAVLVNRKRLIWVAAAGLFIVGAAVALVIAFAAAAASERQLTSQRVQARAENARARAVTELLREVLPSADPDHPELDSAVDAGLARLYFRLETGGFADDPEVDQVLRRLWGSIYTGLGSGKAAGLVQYAEASLRSGLVRLRQQHGAEHPAVAATMHELAGVLLVRKRAPEAESLCRGALAMREKLLGPASTPAAESRLLLGRILYALGRPEESAREADSALKTLAFLPTGDADLAVAAASALRARLYMDAQEPAAAEPLVWDSLARRSRHLPPSDPELLAQLSDAAELASSAPTLRTSTVLRRIWGNGDLPAALHEDAAVLAAPDKGTFEHPVSTGRTAALARSLELQEALLGQSDPALVRVLIAQIRAAEGERLLDTKAAAATRAADILAARFGPEDPYVQVCVDAAAQTLARSGRPQEALEMERRSWRIDQSTPASARDPVSFANSRRYFAWFLSLAGKHDEAVPEYRRSIEEFRAVLGPEHHLVALARADLAWSLAESGKLQQADDLSRQAAEAAQHSATIHEDQLDEVLFVRGHVLRALGKHREALDLLEQAWQPTYEFAGKDFAWRRALITDAAAACKELHDAAGDALWTSRLDRFPEDEPRR